MKTTTKSRETAALLGMIEEGIKNATAQGRTASVEALESRRARVLNTRANVQGV